ncbi:hypothetical protein A2U01_0042025, partial [Trifolium medium]|nr:hypothetical protein [Trifolium medium]
MGLIKESEIQAQPSAQQVEDLPSQKGTEEIQPDPTQSKPEVEVPPTNEDPTPAQVELQGACVIEPSNMAQHDAITTNAPNESDLNPEDSRPTDDDQKQPQVSQEDQAKNVEPTSSDD